MEGLVEVASIVLLGSNYYSDVAEVLGYKGVLISYRGTHILERPSYGVSGGILIGYIGVFRVL